MSGSVNPAPLSAVDLARLRAEAEAVIDDGGPARPLAYGMLRLVGAVGRVRDLCEDYDAAPFPAVLTTSDVRQALDGVE